ncbi:hypothetical protein SteCoe_1014 [Stentor coeruleus]|uniref:MSP domain-containing protein n=1 Tax=Stentor coeruleus TaxID=5963 RepID=A0A1R2D2Z1_9CILI|nr:hypothetical protein SteCoe_1014 [Stentor coeruleus]
MDKEYALLMEPNSVIAFKFVPKASITSSIHLKNNSPSNIAFKIRVTAPNSYYVRPNQGVLLPNEEIKVNVILRPLDTFPTGCPDKFLVQHAVTDLPSNCKQNEITEFWEKNKDKIKSAKLAVFLMEDSSDIDPPASPPSVIHEKIEEKVIVKNSMQDNMERTSTIDFKLAREENIEKKRNSRLKIMMIALVFVVCVVVIMQII